MGRTAYALCLVATILAVVPAAWADEAVSADAAVVRQALRSIGVDAGKAGRGGFDLAGADAGGMGGPFVPMATIAPPLDQARLRRIVTLLPLGAPLRDYRVSSGFGWRDDPFLHRAGFHAGVDLVALRDRVVRCTGAGLVVFAGTERGYGRVVEIDHGYGVLSRYAHLKNIVVRRGQRVKLAQNIGKIGNSGRSSGTHLHYEVRLDGLAYDPLGFIQAGIDLTTIDGGMERSRIDSAFSTDSTK